MFLSLNEVKKRQNFFEVTTSPQTLQLYLEETKLVHRLLTLLRFFPTCNIFPINDQCRVFYFRNRPWYSDEWLKDCVIFLIWQPGFCLIFILSKKRFLIWRLTGNASFMSFLVGIWSRNSEIDKFKISKGLYLQK